MTTDHEIEEALQRLKCTTTPAQDKRILADALATVVEKSETGTTNESPMHSPNRQAVPHPEFEGRTLPKRTRNTRRLIASACCCGLGDRRIHGRMWLKPFAPSHGFMRAPKHRMARSLSGGCPCHGRFLPRVTAKTSRLRTIACGFSIGTTRRRRCFIAFPILQGLPVRVSWHLESYSSSYFAAIKA